MQGEQALGFCMCASEPDLLDQHTTAHKNKGTLALHPLKFFCIGEPMSFGVVVIVTIVVFIVFVDMYAHLLALCPFIFFSLTLHPSSIQEYRKETAKRKGRNGDRRPSTVYRFSLTLSGQMVQPADQQANQTSLQKGG